MKITSDIHEMHSTREGLPARQTITIEIEPGDDDTALINGMVIKGRLEALLRIVGRPGEVLDEGDLWELLVRAGWIGNLTEQRVNEMMWAARDTYGWSWRKIAGAMEMHQSTVRRRVAKTRDQFADIGEYRTASGRHKAASPAEARERAEQAARIEDQGNQ